MRKCNQIIVAGGAIISCYPGLLLADTCTTLPKCPDLGFSVAKSDLATKCAEKTYLKCPFGDYYFCSDVDDGCPEFVTVNPATEVCTKLCPKNSSKCLEKRNITCQEAVSKANGRLIQDGASVCGTQTRTLYLLGKANSKCSSGGVKFIGTSINSAADLAPCEKEMKGEAFYEASSINIEHSVFINVKAKIGTANFYSSNYSGSITLGEDAEINYINGYADNTWHREIVVSAYGHGSDSQKQSLKLGFMCGCSDSGSSFYKPKCNFTINGDYADVIYSTSGECETEVQCNVYEGSCKEGWW